MSFLHPQLLWLLLLPAGLLAAALLRRARAAAVHPKIARVAVGPSGLSRSRAFGPARPVAAAIALACLVIALARPQGAEIAAPGFARSRDVLIAVDVSRSMLAADLAPTRLDRARLLVRDLADELRGERIGLLPFAGSAFLQSPLSADYEIFRTFLDELGPDMIPAGGSDFTALLSVAADAFGLAGDETTADPDAADRYLVVLSDGEAQDDTWRPVAEKLARRGVRVIALGLGTADGALVPAAGGGVVKDERGAAVLSRLSPDTLRELARLSDGVYRDASAWIDLPALLRETVARGRAALVETERSGRREEFFTWCLAPALLLAVLSLVREFPAPLRPRRLVPAAALLALLALLPGPAPLRAQAAAPSPDALVELVAGLSAAASPAPADLARLAELTATLGEASPLPEGALRDALAAVAQGSAAAPAAADWPKLRARLEALLTPPPKPEQPQKPEKPNDDKSEQNSPPESQPSSDDKQNDGQPKPDSGSPDSSKSPGSQSSPDASPSENPGASPDGPPSSSDPSSTPPDAAKPSSDALGELGDPSRPPAAASEPPEPSRLAGGVSASGRPDDETAPAPTDPALVAPAQRMEDVRAQDAPARLFQLMLESERPSETREGGAAPGAPVRDW